MWIVVAYSLLVALVGLSNGQNTSDNFWILLQDTNVFTCNGVNNKFQLKKEDVSCRNSQGREVHYLKAPGTYNLRFNKIDVDQPMPNLCGQMSGILQVPLVQVGSAINKIASWDFPYNIIPERQMFGGYKCDKASGVVQDNGKTYCRYCDLCATTGKAENVLNNKGHKFLPNEGSPNEPPLDQICKQIDAKSYRIERTISLPGKKEMQDDVNSQFSGAGGEVKKRFAKGNGKLQMELQVISCDQPPLDKQKAYSQSSSCRCCADGVNDWTCKINPLGACNKDTCNAQYAQKCLQGKQEKVGCYTVQFNFVVTDKLEDVKAFCAKNHYQDEYNDFSSGGGGSNAGGNGNGGGGGSNAGGNGNVNGGQSQVNGKRRNDCINKMNANYKENCKSHWNDKFCCGRCGGC